MNLDHVRIVLVRPTHPGNIGATARAMRNMGLSRLMLVEPQDFPSDTAAARAAGADDVLTSAEVLPMLLMLLPVANWWSPRLRVLVPLDGRSKPLKPLCPRWPR